MALELDDIQGGAVQERPSPYVGTLPAATDRRPYRWTRARAPSAALIDAGREPRSGPRHARTVAFTYHGLKQLGVPQESLDSFAPEFQQGMAARAADLGDVGESAPENWERPLGTPTCMSRSACLRRTPTDSKRSRHGHDGARRSSLASR